MQNKYNFKEGDKVRFVATGDFPNVVSPPLIKDKVYTIREIVRMGGRLHVRLKEPETESKRPYITHFIPAKKSNEERIKEREAANGR
jgi:hypothetical protein